MCDKAGETRQQYQNHELVLKSVIKVQLWESLVPEKSSYGSVPSSMNYTVININEQYQCNSLAADLAFDQTHMNFCFMLFNPIHKIFDEFCQFFDELEIWWWKFDENNQFCQKRKKKEIIFDTTVTSNLTAILVLPGIFKDR